MRVKSLSWLFVFLLLVVSVSALNITYPLNTSNVTTSDYILFNDNSTKTSRVNITLYNSSGTNKGTIIDSNVYTFPYNYDVSDAGSPTNFGNNIVLSGNFDNTSKLASIRAFAGHDICGTESLSLYFTLYYYDGTNANTNVESTGGGSYYTFTNPNPDKPVHNVTLVAQGIRGS